MKLREVSWLKLSLCSSNAITIAVAAQYISRALRVSIVMRYVPKERCAWFSFLGEKTVASVAKFCQHSCVHVRGLDSVLMPEKRTTSVGGHTG